MHPIKKRGKHVICADTNIRGILNLSMPQMGKTTYTLSETECCIDMLNINLVYQYNISVEDVMEKAKPYAFTCERITEKDMLKYRNALIRDEDPQLPTMLVGIMDVYRAAYLEGLLLWCKERGIPRRMIVDEYDVFGIGFDDRTDCVARDNWLKMVMDQRLVNLIEFNSATNINGMVSNYTWTEINKIQPYDGYCGWDTVQFSTLDESHFTDMLNGEITAQMKRKLARAYESNENMLINLHDNTVKHDAIAQAMVNGDIYDNIKTINYASGETLADVPKNNTLIVGGKKFSRSVSVPNLTTMAYYRKSPPAIANLLQATGRVLGNRRCDPTVITTPQLAKIIEHSFKLEQKIIDHDILYEPHDQRIKWLEEQVANMPTGTRLFTDKSNGYIESKSATFQVVDDASGYFKFDHWHEIDMPQQLWDNWEIKLKNKETGPQMLALCEAAHPHIKDIKGVKDDSDGKNAAARRYIAVRENLEGGYNRYVNSKNSKRKLPILFGAQRGKPGKGFLIVRDADIHEYTDKCYHHNEYGEKMRLVNKQIKKGRN